MIISFILGFLTLFCRFRTCRCKHCGKIADGLQCSHWRCWRRAEAPGKSLHHLGGADNHENEIQVTAITQTSFIIMKTKGRLHASGLLSHIRANLHLSSQTSSLHPSVPDHGLSRQKYVPFRPRFLQSFRPRFPSWMKC